MALNHKPPVSVVIPTHNTRNLTVAAVRSVLEHAPPTTEIIVVDDGSADGTTEALASFASCVTVIRNRQATGFAAAANLGMKETKADILLLLNSDAELTEDGLTGLLGAFDSEERLGVAGARLLFPDGSSQWSGGPFPSLLWAFVLTSGAAALARRLPRYSAHARRRHEGAAPVEWVTGAAMAVRRSLWSTLGPFDTNYLFYAQDMDLCRIAGEDGWSVRIIPDFRVVHHHGTTIGRSSTAVDDADPVLLWPDVLRFLQKHEGVVRARRFRRWMVFGARLRLAARGMQFPFVSSDNRRPWTQATTSYRAALQNLCRIKLL